MTIGVHGHDLLLVAPLWEGTDLRGWLGIGEVWLVGDVEILACHGKSVID